MLMPVLALASMREGRPPKVVARCDAASLLDCSSIVAVHRSFTLVTALVALGVTADARLAAQATVVGSVRDSSGRPISRAFVAVANRPAVFTDSLGHYRLDTVPAGRITITARRVGFNRETAQVDVEPNGTTRRDFILRPVFLPDKPDVWLRCAGAPPTVSCVPGRRVANELTGFHKAGAWIFRDSATFDAFWRAHSPSLEAPKEPPAVSWRHESVVAVSYGGYSGCGPAPYVNRIEHRLDSTIVIVGPDRAYDKLVVTCAAYLETPNVVMIPLAKGPVVFRAANDRWRTPPVVSTSPPGAGAPPGPGKPPPDSRLR